MSTYCLHYVRKFGQFHACHINKCHSCCNCRPYFIYFCNIMVVQRLSVFSSGTNNKGVYNMICTHPSFHSLSFGYLPQPAHMKFIKQIVKAIHLALPSRWWTIDNRNNLYRNIQILGFLKIWMFLYYHRTQSSLVKRYLAHISNQFCPTK